jgi:hypothetical protein
LAFLTRREFFFTDGLINPFFARTPRYNLEYFIAATADKSDLYPDIVESREAEFFTKLAVKTLDGLFKSFPDYKLFQKKENEKSNKYIFNVWLD